MTPIRRLGFRRPPTNPDSSLNLALYCGRATKGTAPAESTGRRVLWLRQPQAPVTTSPMLAIRRTASR